MIKVKIQGYTKEKFQSILRSSGMAHWLERLAQDPKILGPNPRHINPGHVECPL